jgi:hypothetical protein
VREAKSSRQRDEKSRRGERATPRNFKNDDRTDYVYENKGSHDKLPEKEDDISARLHAILHKDACILRKQQTLSSQFTH